MAIRNAMQKLQKQFAAKYGGNAKALSGVIPKNAVNFTPRPSPIPTLNSNTRLAQRPDVSRLNYASMPKPNTTGQNMINPFEQAQKYLGQAGGIFGQMSGPNSVAQEYMNPYVQNVIDRTQQDIARQQQIAQNQLGAEATRAGAFGGDRFGIAQGALAGEYGRMAGDIAAQQRQSAYDTAVDTAFRSAAGLQGVGREAFGRGQVGLQQQQLAAQQQMQQQQQLLDAARLQTLTNLGYPQQSLTFGSGILGGLPRASITESGKMGLTDFLGFTGLF